MVNKVYLESEEGKLFKLTVDNNGVLGTEEIPTKCIPGYEVKFLIDPKVVLNGEELSEDFKKVFELKGITRASYYDTDNLDLNKSGWTIRVRKKSNKKAQQCTFKKRYSGINKGHKLKQNELDKTLLKAFKEGFHSVNESFNEGCEVDYGYSNCTLSFSNDLDIELTGKGNIDIPDEEESLIFIKENKPKDLNLDLGKIREHGPVELKTYSAKIEDIEFSLDILSVVSSKGSDSMETIVELSFKLEDYTGEIQKSGLNTVNKLRDKVQYSLNKYGILLKEDSLKTNIILNRY